MELSDVVEAEEPSQPELTHHVASSPSRLVQLGFKTKQNRFFFVFFSDLSHTHFWFKIRIQMQVNILICSRHRILQHVDANASIRTPRPSFKARRLSRSFMRVWKSLLQEFRTFRVEQPTRPNGLR